jgi:DNA-binding IscR family transcriptional regulator
LFYELEPLKSANTDQPWSKECLVKKVMNGAELHMHQYLQQHTIQSVLDSASFDCEDALNKKQ